MLEIVQIVNIMEEIKSNAPSVYKIVSIFTQIWIHNLIRIIIIIIVLFKVLPI